MQMNALKRELATLTARHTDEIIALIAAYNSPSREDVAQQGIATSGNTPLGASISRSVPGKYEVIVLGKRLRADTLSKMFVRIVDEIHAWDAEVLARFSQVKARKRFFIARSRYDVHAGRRDLPAIQTNSRWWVSENVGTADVNRAVSALCKCARLRYGEDISPVRRR
jgi:hypothetical protein